MEYIPAIILFALLFAFVIGRRVVLWWELNNAGRLRRAREEQARVDHARFERELTDEAIRAGAR